MKKKIIIYVVILIIAIIISIILVKFIRINNFLNKVHKNYGINNFRYEVITNNEEGSALTKVKYLRLNSNYLIISNSALKIYVTDMGDYFSSIEINEEDKTFNKVQIYKENDEKDKEYFTLFGDLKSTYSFFEKVQLCFKWKIKYEKINGNDCIAITDSDNNVTYYDKEKAYVIKKWEKEFTNIQVNSVEKKDIEIPDLKDYTENEKGGI